MLYNVQSADAATLALADGTSLLSYYDPPVSNLTLQSSALLQLVPGFVSLDGCGRRCLSERTCQAFSIAVSSGVCRLYLATRTPDNEMPMEGADYYQKQQDRVSRVCTNIYPHVLQLDGKLFNAGPAILSFGGIGRQRFLSCCGPVGGDP